LIYIIGSGVLTIIQLGAQWLTARRNGSGWALRVLANTISIPYNIITHQYFFLMAAATGITLAINPLRSWSWSYHGACASCEEMILSKIEASLRRTFEHDYEGAADALYSDTVRKRPRS